MKRKILKILTASVLIASSITCTGLFNTKEAKAAEVNCTSTETIIRPLHPPAPKVEFDKLDDVVEFDERCMIPKVEREAMDNFMDIVRVEHEKRLAEEAERKRQEEIARKEYNRQVALNNMDNLQPVHIDRGGTSALWNTQLALTFYTDLAVENGGWANITTSGKPLKTGAVATGSQVPFGTVFMSDKLTRYIGSSTVIVEDRMLQSESYKCNDNQIRVDVFVPRRSGEDDYSYLRRINSMGRPTISASVLRWGR